MWALMTSRSSTSPSLAWADLFKGKQTLYGCDGSLFNCMSHATVGHVDRAMPQDKADTMAEQLRAIAKRAVDTFAEIKNANWEEFCKALGVVVGPDYVAEEKADLRPGGAGAARRAPSSSPAAPRAAAPAPSPSPRARARAAPRGA